MFDWWFAWHPIDRLRYGIWDHDDHYDVYLDDPIKARDITKSMRERHWGSVHHVWEDIGMGNGLLTISFKRPRELGYDESLVDTEHCNALVCANCCTVGNSDMPDIPVVMTHFLCPVEGGSELRSRFWFGYQILDGQSGEDDPRRDGHPRVRPRVPAAAQCEGVCQPGRHPAQRVRRGEGQLVKPREVKQPGTRFEFQAVFCRF